MGFTKTHLVLLVVTISMLFAPTTNAIGIVKAIRTPQARIYSMCKSTTNPPLCFRTILPKALVTPKFNKYKAIEVEIQAASVLVNKTVAIIKTLLPKFAKDKNIFDTLTICDEQYGMMVDAITETIRSIALRDAIEAKFKMSGVVSYYVACKDTFVESETVAPFAADAELLSDHAANSLDIMASIVDKKGNAGKAPLA